ncbi:acyl-CoA dehydrogenase family protein [Fluoribacter dumoffii]|uniref:Acyl-CoA dehydrogenase, short-chain specific n=2 Tax=Fluoribacter dumoffii TaxID=463 RepID=A0A377G702_9GAMM|nr:acyl-CoA dehydrogenase family protein [Fluoribacter dumoffii]KTC89476.1 glutaryl-CoA dehydrogenase [Fluoribacter dumoffii NY 23]MCW8386728.1 acyl-CoA dehydrogenase family protein [Fluoribacter dumoffii]MCW8417737.1 acyl-CoA dehydrogenase family protein [Fluoribacter dumoffii]MCW8454421.1 acyl-CoA dehydrogenase family protein [Fluoribacter dumoffii]MCW8461505.1 acyl-CoA dehydrogenase family protein [Fluoribacter dumoffii]
MDDLLFLDEQLNGDERMIRDSVARFVSNDVMPLMAESFEHAQFPRELIRKSAEMGLLGLTLPAEYGGAEASYVAYGLVCQELERGDSGLRSFVSVQSSLCMFPIFRYGSEEQRVRFLPGMATGEIIGCFGLTEPDFGSDPAGMRTTAKKVKGGWTLNGAKMWITNSPIADIAIVWAKTDEGVRGFIVDTKSEGLSRPEIKLKMSLRASITGELVFDNVFVPDENYLPGSEKGLGAPLSCLSQARYGIAWGAMGAAMACFDITRDYLLERKQFNKPLASFQLIQKDLADMYTEIIKAQCLNLQIGRIKDNHRENPVMISLAKGNACREALKIARKCRNLLGANGISLEYHVIRHMLNLESVFTYEGTDNVHTLVLGKHITGINAFA